MSHLILDEHAQVVPPLASKHLEAHDYINSHADPKVEGNSQPSFVTVKHPQSNFLLNHSSSMFIRLLPLEIIAEIFKHYVFPAPDQPITAFLPTPLFLGSICSYWRRIAWSIPSLWSSLILVFSVEEEFERLDLYDRRFLGPRCFPGDRFFSSVKLELFDQWLSRTGNFPLSIIFSYGSVEEILAPDVSDFAESDGESDEGRELLVFGDNDFTINTIPIPILGQDDDDSNSNEDSENSDDSDSNEDAETSDGSYIYVDPEHSDCESNNNPNAGHVEESDQEVLEDPDKQWQSLMDLMNRHAPRWHSLDFRLPFACFHWPDFPIFLQTLPNLKFLRLNLEPMDSSSHISIPGYPMLQHLNLVNFHFYRQDLYLPWSQILHLDLTICPINVSMQILYESSNIVSCSLVYPLACWSDGGLPDENWRFEHSIQLPHLKKLAIDNQFDLDLQHFLHTISSPILTEFCYEGGKITNCAPICDFISRSPNLHAFSLKNTKIPNPDILVQLLRGFENVAQLTLVTSSLSSSTFTLNDHILRLCTPGGFRDDQCLLPALEIFSYTGPPTFTSEVMGQFIESRKPKMLRAERGGVTFFKSATYIADQDESSETLNIFFRATPITLP